MQRIISLFLALLISFSLCAVPVSAETKSAVWDGTVSTAWFTGKKDGYSISTPSQLAGLAKLVNEGNPMEGVVINLTADLVMNNTDGWKDWYKNPPKYKFTPIGRSGNAVKGYFPFSGIFNGNGHSISGLYVNNYREAGLFGLLCGGCVSNLIIKQSVIIGYDDGKTQAVNTGVYAGAVAGIADRSVINMCENDGLVYSRGPSDIFCGDRTAYAGGIVGSMHKEILSQEVLSGGLAMFGVFYNPAIFTDGKGGLIKGSGVVNCINFGSVTAICVNTAYSGGIVGSGSIGDVRNCLNLWQPSVRVENSRKGIIGQIAGYMSNCNMSNCYYWCDKKSLRAVGDDMKSSVVDVKREATACGNDDIISKALAEKLGTAFVYVKDDKPYIASDLRIINN